MKTDNFSLPYSQRSCPDGMVPEVWQVFCLWADCNDQKTQQQYWLDYLDIHSNYYDKDGNRLPVQTDQLQLF
ncbi:hypothetical protein [Spirosoma endbachense]|uniref:Uncharacterized protein n=1 Tax=Spirosoma endbachense TaxID=2666025 RepID=A0A6P1VW06_9BACT|nr:hypothetical protein [Spirosoma endbachense]QHV96272.1 hypothetical protein GJR95_15165 [Spirosoma endbachense]